MMSVSAELINPEAGASMKLARIRASIFELHHRPQAPDRYRSRDYPSRATYKEAFECSRLAARSTTAAHHVGTERAPLVRPIIRLQISNANAPQGTEQGGHSVRR